MKLLADENIDPRVIEWLRADGYDVFAIHESASGAADTDVLTLANEQSRAIITRDKDFGELVYRYSLPVPGVALMRYHIAD